AKCAEHLLLLSTGSINLSDRVLRQGYSGVSGICSDARQKLRGLFGVEPYAIVVADMTAFDCEGIRQTIQRRQFSNIVRFVHWRGEGKGPCTCCPGSLYPRPRCR